MALMVENVEHANSGRLLQYRQLSPKRSRLPAITGPNMTSSPEKKYDILVPEARNSIPNTSILITVANVTIGPVANPKTVAPIM